MGQHMWGRVLPSDNTEMKWRCKYYRARWGDLRGKYHRVRLGYAMDI
jgi:hypothetical protein